MLIPVWLQAGLWGLIAGSALLLGAAVGFFARVPQRLIAAVMAFGGGVLISALAFDLMDEAYQRGGFDSTAVGFLGGAAIYTAANWYLSHHGARHRKRSGGQQPSEEEDSGSGLAIFLSNIPEGLSSSAGMKKACRPAGYVFGVWAMIAVISGVAALLGYALFSRFTADVVAGTTAVAAGAILALLAGTMIPEAFAPARHGGTEQVIATLTGELPRAGLAPFAAITWVGCVARSTPSMRALCIQQS